MVGRSLDSYMSSYDNFLVIGDLNSEISEMAMSEFCETYNLQNLVKDPSCYKNPSKPTCIDLILTNFPKSFQHTQTIETGLSDFHKLTLTVLKTHFPRLKQTLSITGTIKVLLKIIFDLNYYKKLTVQT